MRMEPYSRRSSRSGTSATPASSHKTPVDCPVPNCNIWFVHQHPSSLQYYKAMASHPEVTSHEEAEEVTKNMEDADGPEEQDGDVETSKAQVAELSQPSPSQLASRLALEKEILELVKEIKDQADADKSVETESPLESNYLNRVSAGKPQLSPDRLASRLAIEKGVYEFIKEIRDQADVDNFIETELPPLRKRFVNSISNNGKEKQIEDPPSQDGLTDRDAEGESDPEYVPCGGETSLTQSQDTHATQQIGAYSTAVTELFNKRVDDGFDLLAKFTRPSGIDRVEDFDPQDFDPRLPDGEMSFFNQAYFGE